MDNLPVRKSNRLKGYDYSRDGLYFITICTKNHEELFGNIAVGANCVRPLSTSTDRRSSTLPSRLSSDVHTQLSRIGEIIEDEITILSSTYDNIVVDKYVIMPNHVHMILFVMNCERIKDCWRTIGDESGRTQFAPTISRIVKQWKGAITKKTKFSLWQKSFHDHIIHDEEEYYRIAKYIKDNPAKWVNDRYYKKGII
jgi:REP element-mobilizing transposase RayT